MTYKLKKTAGKSDFFETIIKESIYGGRVYCRCYARNYMISD